MTRPPKFLPTLTEVVAGGERPPSKAVPASAPLAQHVHQQARVLSEQETARMAQQLALSHWLERRLSPALRDWVEREVANEVASQVELLAPVWAKALAEAVSVQVKTRIPGIVDRLLQETAPSAPDRP